MTTTTVLHHALPWSASLRLAGSLRRRGSRRPRRTAPGTASRLAAAPQRFGDCYRWADGSWTSSG